MIKWLTSLERGKLVVAMLLIALASVVVYAKQKDKELTNLQEAYRKELIVRTDSCEHQKLRITEELNTKFENFLRGQINKFEDAQKRIDSTVASNKVLIRKNKGVIKKLKP